MLMAFVHRYPQVALPLLALSVVLLSGGIALALR
jgi:hypothetical protein